MRSLILGIVTVFVVAAGLELPAAQDRPPLVFEELPDLGATIDSESLRDLAPVPGNLSSIVLITANGQVCEYDLQRGTTRNPFLPLGASSRVPVSIAMGSLNGTTLDTIVAGPAEASTRPLSLFEWGTPPSLLGEVGVAESATAGMRLAFGDVTADRTPELVISFGPGGPALVRVIEVGRDNEFTFAPFGPDFAGGIYVATGDLNGDGHAEILTSQERGGELKVFEVTNNEAIEYGRGRPFGHGFSGGVRVSAFDFNNDGKAEIITAPIMGEPRVRVFDVAPTNTTRLLADFLAFDQARDGGVSVAAGLVEGKPNILTSSGRFFRRFELGPDGRFDIKPGLPENPFQQIADILLGVQTYTPPPPDQQ